MTDKSAGDGAADELEVWCAGSSPPFGGEGQGEVPLNGRRAWDAAKRAAEPHGRGNLLSLALSSQVDERGPTAALGPAHDGGGDP